MTNIADDRDEDLPAFLNRRLSAEIAALNESIRAKQAEDRERAEKFRAEIEAKRLAKSRGRVAKMLAKKNGDTKRMPLSGKAALDYIKRG